MEGVLERDLASGRCQGECRDRVKETGEELQRKINTENIETPETMHVKWAESRDVQPGVYGGHI